MAKAPWCVQSGEHIVVGLVFMFLEGAMARTSLPYNVDCPARQEAKGLLLYTLHITFHVCPTQNPLPLLSNVRGGLGGRAGLGRSIALLLLHKSLEGLIKYFSS